MVCAVHGLPSLYVFGMLHVCPCVEEPLVQEMAIYQQLQILLTSISTSEEQSCACTDSSWGHVWFWCEDGHQ